MLQGLIQSDVQTVFSRGVRECGSNVKRWSKEHRLQPTPAEKRFSEILVEIGARGHFRDQQALYGFILDFYSVFFMLAIEIDGGYHDAPEQRQYDFSRTEKLNRKGISVLRFTNDDVMNNPHKVMMMVQSKIKACAKANRFKHAWKPHQRIYGPKVKPDPTFPTDAFIVARA